MTLSLPPQYVPLPVDVIEQAYAPDKPHRALFASFVRLLSLAWENKYQQSPRIREEELYNTRTADGSVQYGYLKLERRQYFEQRREMELLGWLRSTHPAIGFVQFSFTRSIQLDHVAECEKVPADAKKRTVFMRMEEEDSFESLNTDSSSSSSLKQNVVQKIAQPLTAESESEKKMQLLIEQLPLLFDPKEYGLLEFREIFLAGIPERVLGWIAKAYQDRARLDSPMGVIVTHILNQDAPKAYYLAHLSEILTADYLEAVGEFEIECDYCLERFPTRAEKDEHRKTIHTHHCDECGNDFETGELAKAHYEERHSPYRARKPKEYATIPMPVVLDGGWTAEKAWQAVLNQLQMEMPRASFETWVQSSQVVRYDGNTFHVATRNIYARDWLENRLTATVQKMLIGILGMDVTVRFVVLEGNQA